MQPSDVYMTMVDGNVLYKNGEFYTIDIEKAIFESNICINLSLFVSKKIFFAVIALLYAPLNIDDIVITKILFAKVFLNDSKKSSGAGQELFGTEGEAFITDRSSIGLRFLSST
jgi:hypothetical protein